MQMRIFDEGHSLYQIAPNQTTAPKGAIRSCAISSLILQAELVFNGWGKCGYMLNEGADLKLLNVSDSIEATVISGPPNNTKCTPKMMRTKECATKFVRTTYRNSQTVLRSCLAKVKGVSETCAAYKKCGPRIYQTPAPGSSADTGMDFSLTDAPAPAPASSSPQSPPPGVCNTPSVGYFREEQVQRMCGICDMFEAIMPPKFQSPSAKFANSLYEVEPSAPAPARRSRGTETWMWVLLVVLVILGAAALFAVCVQTTSKETAQRVV